MSLLYEAKCAACRSDSPSVTDRDIEQLHPQVAEWSLIVENEIKKLQRIFRFRNFGQALVFTNRIGDIAETEGHHPRLVTEWGRVGITWWTHKIRDLHHNDFIMAAKTDQIFLQFLESTE